MGEKILKLKSLEINTVFSVHSKPFPMELLIKNHRENNKEES